jgi:hypothetical protein
LVSPFSPPRFVSDEPALDAVLIGIKLVACPYCRQTGALIGHGFLRGYAERSSEVVVRGRRVFCSNRARRRGCGRTFSVKLAAVLCGFLVRTLTLWRFASAVVGGLTRRAAWLLAAGSALSLSSGYRLWRRLRAAQSALRARLWREQPAPSSAAHEPLAQLFAHLGVVVAAGVATVASDLFAAYQQNLQRGLFER